MSTETTAVTAVAGCRLPSTTPAGRAWLAAGQRRDSMMAIIPFRLFCSSTVLKLGSNTDTAGIPMESSQLVASPLTVVPGKHRNRVSRSRMRCRRCRPLQWRPAMKGRSRVRPGRYRRVHAQKTATAGLSLRIKSRNRMVSASENGPATVAGSGSPSHSGSTIHSAAPICD